MRKFVLAGLAAWLGLAIAGPSMAQAPEGALVLDGEVVADAKLYGAARGGSLNLGTYMIPITEQAMIDEFTRLTGVKVNMTRLPTSQLVERALSEHGAGVLSFDVLRLSDTTSADEMVKQGVYVPMTTPFDEQLARDGANVGDGSYVSSHYIAVGFAYNSEAIDPADIPATWKDLLKPAFKDRIGIVNPNGSGVHTATTAMLMDLYGVEYLEELAKLQPRIFESTGPQAEALSRGELLVGPQDPSGGIRMKNAGAPVKMVIPQEGISASYNPLGLTPRGKENPAAQLYVNFLLSKVGQRLHGHLGLLPVRSDIGDIQIEGQPLPKPGDKNLFIFTKEDQRTRQAGILAEWNRIFKY